LSQNRRILLTTSIHCIEPIGVTED